jgi:hypothetical protein
MKKGVWTTVLIGDKHDLVREVSEKYGRNPKNKILKIFTKEPLEDSILDDFRWGGDSGFPIHDTIRMQNIANFHGLAPRAYSLDVVDYEDKKCVAKLTDFVEGQPTTTSMEPLDKVLKQFGVLYHQECIDYGMNNFINNQLVDFQTIGLDEEIYLKKITEILQTNVFGFLYQDVPEIDLNTHRNIRVRTKSLGLDDVSFTGKTVLDIGCSNGMFCNYFHQRGAKRVIGLDIEELAFAAKHLSNYLKNYNIDYYGVDLKKETYENLRKMIGIDKFDIILFLSMNAHVGIPDFIMDFCGGDVYFEKSGGEINEKEVDSFLKLFIKERLANSPDMDRECWKLCLK